MKALLLKLCWWYILKNQTNALDYFIFKADKGLEDLYNPQDESRHKIMRSLPRLPLRVYRECKWHKEYGNLPKYQDLDKQ